MKFNGREVEIKEFTIRELKPMREAFEADQENGMWYVLVCSAHYADDGSKVFENVEAILDQPAKKSLLISAMANKAMEANGIGSKTDPLDC
jgi:hypothetical protein